MRLFTGPNLLSELQYVVTRLGDSLQIPPVTRRIYLLLLIVGYSSGFLITSSRPGQITVAPGDKVTLFCAVDDDYEWCKFHHPDGKFCDFEWKRRKGNITMQECQLAGKLGVLFFSSLYFLFPLGPVPWCL